MSDNKIEVDKRTLDTLLYFALGVTLQDSLETVVTKIVDKAFRDATNQGAFNALLKDEDVKNRAKEAVRKAKKKLIKALINYKRQGGGFQKWHDDTCDIVLRQFIDENVTPFSFGNAQKAVNMSMKYLYLLSYFKDYPNINSELKRLLEAVMADANQLHMPIDSYILDALVKKEIITSEDVTLKGKKTRINKFSEYVRPSEYIKSWSTWNRDDYDKIAQIIAQRLDGLIPIEWEEENWIEQAKKRRNKEETENTDCS